MRLFFATNRDVRNNFLDKHWPDSIRALLTFWDILKKMDRKDIQLELSTRQLLRIALRIAQSPQDLHATIHQTFLSKLLPSSTREMLDKLLSQAGIKKAEKGTE